MTELGLIRKKIDQIDDEIIEKISERFRLAFQTLPFKTKTGDRKREALVISRARKKASELKFLRPDFVEVLFRLVIRESRRLQNQLDSYDPSLKKESE
jgi:chorismate mutase